MFHDHRIPSAAAIGGLDLRRCRNILVVKFDRIGDWVLCTPFLRNLRRNASHAQITALVLPAVYPLAVACPYVDRVIARRPGGDRLSFSGTPRALETFLDDYYRGRFDLAIVPRWDVDFDAAGIVAAGSKAPFVIGFGESCTERKRLFNRGYDRFYTHTVDSCGVRHEVDRTLGLLPAMGGTVGDDAVTVHTLADDEREAARVQARTGGRPMLAVGPFANEAKRMLASAHVAQIIRHVATAHALDVLLIGGPADAARAAQLARLAGDAVTVTDLNVRAAAALIRRCVALIGVDSGPAHLAAGVGTPAAVISCHPMQGAPDDPNSPVRFGPWAPDGLAAVFRPAVATTPCRGSCRATEPHCITTIPEPMLTRSLTRFVGEALAGHRSRGRGTSAPEHLALVGD